MTELSDESPCFIMLECFIINAGSIYDGGKARCCIAPVHLPIPNCKRIEYFLAAENFINCMSTFQHSFLSFRSSLCKR